MQIQSLVVKIKIPHASRQLSPGMATKARSTLINILNISISISILGFPGGSEVQASACKAGDPGSIPGSGRSPGEGNGNPLQDSCLENPMDRGAWGAIVYGVTKGRTQLRD